MHTAALWRRLSSWSKRKKHANESKKQADESSSQGTGQAHKLPRWQPLSKGDLRRCVFGAQS